MSPICSIGIPSREKSPSSSRRLLKWAEDIVQYGSKLASLESGRPEHGLALYLPNLSIVLKNGDAKLLVTPQASHRFDLSDPESQYPSRFRIPPATLVGLSIEECMTRAQHFAIGSLVFALMTGKPPFAILDDSLVQQNFENGLYPPETIQFPMEISIPVLGCWSWEFAEVMKQQTGFHAPSRGQTPLAERMRNHAKANPIKTGIVGTGALVFVAASLVNPVLAVAGFSVMGPAAASAAAAWQSSIGLVQAGSFFAWCQSVAMGGAAGAIMTAQGVGATAAGLGILDAFRSAGLKDEEARQVIWNFFVQSVRKVE